ncbi:MAG: discoidin domain-containing protein, partial [Clostridia bacterium]|nr:discoidin domain-containing protein [Clostridia bacterium]
TAIYGFEVSTLGGGSAGVYAPTEITVYVSDDGVNFRVAASEKFPADVGIDSGARITRSIKLASDISGRYVKFTVATNQSWIFIDELRVFAD